MTACRNTRRNGAFSIHRCERPAVLDGYCTRHHPNYWSPQMWASLSEEDRAEIVAEGRGPSHFAAAIKAARSRLG